jgi:L-ascorbate metabolism protein UlaG (beta-lactamase superfamily)
MIEPDTLPTSAGDLTIQPIDHASLVLRLGAQTIYIDPVGGAARYAGLPPPTAVLVTHEHGDHFDPQTLDALIGPRSTPIITAAGVAEKLTPRLLEQATVLGYGESGTLDGIHVTAIAAHNTSPDRLRYHPRGLGNGYVLTLGDKRLYVSGDTEPTPEMLALENIDVAFLPMNLPYTMLAEQAAEAAKTFKPAVVYPFHYGSGPEPEKFADLMQGFPGVEVRLRDWYALR